MLISVIPVQQSNGVAYATMAYGENPKHVVTENCQENGKMISFPKKEIKGLKRAKPNC